MDYFTFYDGKEGSFMMCGETKEMIPVFEKGGEFSSFCTCGRVWF